jgi:hypothetical protein
VTSHTDDLLQPAPEIAIQPKEICDMWPFTRMPIVDDETAAWHVENFTWLIEEFRPGGFRAYQARPSNGKNISRPPARRATSSRS